MFEKKIYVGKKIVKQIIENIDQGDNYVKIEFEDGKIEVFGKEIFGILKSDKPITDTELRDKKIYFVAEKILGLLLVHNVKPSEFEFLTAVLQGSLNENIKKANDKLWGKPASERTMLDVQKVLEKKSDNI